MTSSISPLRHTLVISCPDRPGLVAAVATCIADCGGTLVESHNYTDEEKTWFFMRNVIAGVPEFDDAMFRKDFERVATENQMEWSLSDNHKLERMVILASHASHCVADLLFRLKTGELPCSVPCVISNHEGLRSMVEWHGIPYHYVPIPKAGKETAFRQIEEIVDRHDADLVVLARFMQILPPELCEKYARRLVNIHHSFLPSFIGANPYQKAHERGVKLIGATCHYVTSDLDEGPIIEQDVVRVDHSFAKTDLVRIGRDVESSVLSRGVRYHLEHRVLVQGNKTIVFN